MRARLPDESGYAANSGVRIHYEVHGTGQPTILLLPTWAIVDSRHWKMQVPFLARDYRVITFDPRGNGRSDRCRSEEHTSELQSHLNLVCRLLLEKKKRNVMNRGT